MKPQPPVTNMRIAAGTSSVAEAAPLVSPPPSDAWENLKRRAAETDWTPWIIVGLGALLRFFLLGIKPPHFDEGINGWFVDQMVKNAFYKYDPTNYHGPLHFYVLLLSQTLFGRNVWALRLPVVLVSISCVWLTFKFEPFVGRTVSRMAAVAMAVSTGFVFYGRYSIHEVWLVLFSMLFILGLLGLWRIGTTNYLWCAGMGLTGMILTKETYIIHLSCALLAIPITWLASSSITISRQRSKRPPIRGITPRSFIPVFLVAMVAGFFMSWPLILYVPPAASVGILIPALLPSDLISVHKQPSDVAEMLPAKQKWDFVDLAVVGATSIALIVFFYSGTFFHWNGVKGLYEA